jgi:prevent-host-death family protein
MRTITVTDARKRFGALLKAVQQKPIRITRKNCDVVVVVSVEEYKRISGAESFDAIPLRLTRRLTSSSKPR